MLRTGFVCTMYIPTTQNILEATKLLRTVFDRTPLQYSKELSKTYNANIFLKREDCTPVRSYKLRGAFVKMDALVKKGNLLSIVACSAGNHAQGVAFGCDAFKVRGDIFMPKNTTAQKIQRVKQIGGDYVRVFLEGNNYDECQTFALEHCRMTRQPFMHPFDDEQVIEGQGTVGHEILEQMQEQTQSIDYVLLPIGGGGLAAGVSSYLRECSPNTQIVGTGPRHAPAMYASLLVKQIVSLATIQTFVDGASVKRVGTLNFPIIQANLHQMLQIDEGHVCSKMIQMYNECGLILEPAGVLSLCGLDHMNPSAIQGKTIVVILSGGNSDIFRMPEIFERARFFEGRIQYFRIHFPQRAGALKDFIQTVLNADDDIIYFRYIKRINRETGPVILGIETKSKNDLPRLLASMDTHAIQYECMPSHPDLE